MSDLNIISYEQLATQICGFCRYINKVEEEYRKLPMQARKELVTMMQDQGYIYITANAPNWWHKCFWYPSRSEDIIKVPFSSLYFTDDLMFFACDVDYGRCDIPNVYTVVCGNGEWDFNGHELHKRWAHGDEFIDEDGNIDINGIDEDEMEEWKHRWDYPPAEVNTEKPFRQVLQDIRIRYCIEEDDAR